MTFWLSYKSIVVSPADIRHSEVSSGIVTVAGHQRMSLLSLSNCSYFGLDRIIKDTRGVASLTLRCSSELNGKPYVLALPRLSFMYHIADVGNMVFMYSTRGSS